MLNTSQKSRTDQRVTEIIKTKLRFCDFGDCKVGVSSTLFTVRSKKQEASRRSPLCPDGQTILVTNDINTTFFEKNKNYYRTLPSFLNLVLVLVYKDYRPTIAPVVVF